MLNWKVDESGYAHGDGPRVDVEVELDADADLWVHIHEGSGYLSQECSAFIPMNVLLQLLRARGYSVSESV